MAVVDVVCGVLVLVAGLRGAVRGFVAEVFSVGAIAVGLTVAIVGFPIAALQLDVWWGASVWNRVIAFLALFVASYLLLKIIEATLHRCFASLRLGRLDHALGLFVGLAEGLIVGYVLLVLLLAQPVIDVQPWFAESLVHEVFLPWILENLQLPSLPAAAESPTI